MKKVYNPISDFCVSEKRCCFWVRVVVQTVELSLRKQQNRRPYFYATIFRKTTENTLPK